MPKRRVCHVTTLTNLGGVERLVSDLILADHDNPQIEHYLMTTASDPVVLAPILASGVSHFEASRKWRFDPRALWQMTKWLKKQQIDVVHCYNAFANVYGSIAARMAGVHTIYCGEHGTAWWVKPPFAWLDQLVQRTATGTIANSQSSKQMLQLRYGISAETIHVVHNGVIDNRPEPTQKPVSDNAITTIGTIGRLDTPKFFHRFIEAAALVVTKRPDVRFVIVGGGPLEATLRQQVANLELQEYVTLTGWRSDARVMLEQFDLFVSTSIRETFGLALVEAALAGKAAIAPAVDGIPEVLQDGVTGLVLTPDEMVDYVPIQGATPLSTRVLINGEISSLKSVSAETLATAIVRLIDNDDLRACFGRNARTAAIQQFSFDHYRAQLTQCYLGTHQ